jgi:hypothetical protein
MAKPATIIEALTHPDLLGASFPEPASWAKWHTILRAIFALRMSADDLATFKQLTGRERPDPKGYQTAWFCIGRRSGKSRMMAAIAVYMGCFRDWSKHLASGETAHIVLAARDRQQAQAMRGYIVGMLRESLLLSRLIVAETGEGIQLQGNVQISVQTSDYRSIRGRTIAVALLDEVGFWPSDANSASPDVEILNALKPAMITMKGSLLIGGSTPYARKGILWQAYEANYGRDTDTLVVQAPTTTMNENISAAYVEKEIARDPANKSEYLALWREDCEAFVSLDSVKACVASYIQRGYDSSKRYHAFLDPSGGRSDATALAIGHRERDSMHIDLVWSKKAPFDPLRALEEVAQLCRMYRVGLCYGDAYGGDNPKSILQRFGLPYTLIKKVRAELYRDLLPIINSQSVTLPDDPELIRQLVGLERTITAGKEKIDHPRSGHDDLANAVAGCCELLAREGLGAVACFGVQDGSRPYWTYGTVPTHHDGPVEIKGAGDSGTGFATTRR